LATNVKHYFVIYFNFVVRTSLPTISATIFYAFFHNAEEALLERGYGGFVRLFLQQIGRASPDTVVFRHL